MHLIMLTKKHVQSIPNFQQSTENMENVHFLNKMKNINAEAKDQCIYFYELGKRSG